MMTKNLISKRLEASYEVLSWHRMSSGLVGMGDRIRNLRETAGYSQLELAVALKKRHGVEVHQTHVSGMETGRKQPSVSVLAALAEVLETNTDYLLGLTDDPAPHSDLEDQIVVGVKDSAERARLQEALNILKTFSEPEQKTHLELLRMVIKPRPPRIIGSE